MPATMCRIQTYSPETVVDPILDGVRYTDGVVTKVGEWGDGYQDITWTDDTEKPYNETIFGGFAPQEVIDALGRTVRAGDWVRFYGEGLGSPVLGMAIAGRIVFYQTEEDLALYREVTSIVSEGFERYRFDRTWPDIAKRILRLPQPLREKLGRIMKNRPDRIHRNIPYELFCCEQAAALAAHFGNDSALREWSNLDPEDQAEIDIPGFNSMGHSGNTFAFSVLLARLLLTSPEDATRMHSAMAIIVGCNDAGCHTDEDFEKEERNNG